MWCRLSFGEKSWPSLNYHSQPFLREILAVQAHPQMGNSSDEILDISFRKNIGQCDTLYLDST